MYYLICSALHPLQNFILLSLFLLSQPQLTITDCSDDSEYEDSVYSRSDSDCESSCQGAGALGCQGAGALLSEPEIKFTSEELSGLHLLVEKHDEQYKSVNFGETLIKEMIMCSMFGIPVSMSAAISGYRLTVERITRIANHLDSFGTLPKMDQNSLLKVILDYP